MQKIKKPVSILLAVLMVFSLFAVVPFTASALTIDDAQSLLSSMEAKMNDYYAQGDWDRAEALKNYYDWLDEELEYAEGQITPELENAYNESYEYFMAISGSGVSYPDVNNVYWATNEWVDVTVSDLQPGDVLGSSSNYLSVRKGDCDIVLVGGTYCDEDTLSRTYPNNVTLGNDIEFHFTNDYARIIDGDKHEIYSPVYNNALGNAYMVIGKENGTVYLAGYYITIYTITWKLDADTVIDTTTVEDGATPTHDDATKPEDDDYTYTFTGWTPEIVAATGDATYTATFTAVPKRTPADDVKDLINALPATVTVDNKEQIETARNAYEALSDDEKAKIDTDTLDKLVTAETALAAVEKAAADQAAADPVINQINDLPAEITLNDKATVQAARQAYDALTDDQKALVTPETLDKLTAAETALAKATADKTAADAVTAQINALPTENVTLNDKTNIEAARAAYDALTGDQKALITEETLDKLTAAETALAAAEKLFPQHSVSLGGDIGVNFYIDPAAAGAGNNAAISVLFSWNGQTRTVNAVYDPDKGLFKATCYVVAAEVACDITAVATVNNVEQAQTDTYSVQTYAEEVYKNPAAYDTKGRPEQLKKLAQALLNYGAMAQTVFVEYMEQVKAPADIVSTVGKTNFNAVSADDIAGAAPNWEAVEAELGCKYYTSSVLYLQNNTLRLYFTPNTYPGEMPHAGDFKGNQSSYYYYVEKANIAAAELDDRQSFTIGDTTFTFSALDYAKAVVNSGMGGNQKDLAKALYLYNKAANAYFDAAPAPVQNIVDLSTLEGDYEAKDGDVLTGTLGENYKVTIADGATVTLRNANIAPNSSVASAGINLSGDATIMLEGANTVKGGNQFYPGIYVPENKTLIIDGEGSLSASSNGYSAGIGSGYNISGGNIVINSGTITATGGKYSAGIGSGRSGTFGTITINGGTVNATGGQSAAGIGSGFDEDTMCESITITGGTVNATGGYSAAGIGSGAYSSCGNITIADTVTQVTATKGEDASNSIGAGSYGSCDGVTIEDGANVIQN